MKTHDAILVLFAALMVPAGFLSARTPDSVAGTPQAFVDKLELAGAVALVAGNDGILSAEAVMKTVFKEWALECFGR